MRFRMYRVLSIAWQGLTRSPNETECPRLPITQPRGDVLQTNSNIELGTTSSPSTTLIFWGGGWLSLRMTGINPPTRDLAGDETAQPVGTHEHDRPADGGLVRQCRDLFPFAGS